jgi:hypothetical protein
MNNPLIQYRTLDQLLSEAKGDLPTIHQEGWIQPSQLIKVAQRVNYDLGLKMNQEKEAIVSINRRLGRLPDDFEVLNYSHAIHDKRKIPYYIKPGQHVISDCPNFRFRDCGIEAEVISKEHIRTNFDHGELHINYLGALVDEHGNLLVVDHPMLNEYYEYAIKQRILENMFLDGEPVQEKLTFIEGRYRAARNNALTIANTPDFKEMKKIWDTNRQAQLKRYYYIFV